ncbi:hypothetical protein, partial [Cupriavidus numazuensis]
STFLILVVSQLQDNSGGRLALFVSKRSRNSAKNQKKAHSYERATIGNRRSAARRRAHLKHMSEKHPHTCPEWPHFGHKEPTDDSPWFS